MKNIGSMALSMLLFVYASGTAAGGWSEVTKIASVYPYSDGSVFLTFQGPIINPDVCNNDTKARIRFDHPANGKFYALALTALAADKQVRYQVNGCQTYPLISHMKIFP